MASALEAQGLALNEDKHVRWRVEGGLDPSKAEVGHFVVERASRFGVRCSIGAFDGGGKADQANS